MFCCKAEAHFEPGRNRCAESVEKVEKGERQSGPLSGLVAMVST